MQLWACGFNAWRQLRFAHEVGESLNSDEVTQEPIFGKDLEAFECVLDGSDIEVLKTSHSATLGELFFSQKVNTLVTCRRQG